jgi:hypothetical protein
MNGTTNELTAAIAKEVNRIRSLSNEADPGILASYNTRSASAFTLSNPHTGGSPNDYWNHWDRQLGGTGMGTQTDMIKRVATAIIGQPQETTNPRDILSKLLEHLKTI